MIPSLVEAALRALLVAAVVWAGLRSLRVTNVLAQKAAWGLVLFSALLMPLAMRSPALLPGLALVLPVHLGQKATPPAAAPEPLESVAEPSPRPASIRLRRLPAVDAARGASLGRFPAPFVAHIAGSGPGLPTPSAAPNASTTPTSRSLSLATLAALLYLALLTGLMGRIVYALCAAARLWLRAQPVVPDSLPHPSRALAQGLRLRASSSVASPVTIGSGVLLPANFASWDSEKLRIVLAHERSHVRQGDFYLQLLAEIHAAVFWFSPLGWWLKRKLSDLSETISDRAGLEAAANGPSYAQVLLEFAATPRPTLTGVAMARSNNLSRRIERLLNEPSFRLAFAGGRRRALLAVLLVPIALIAATSLVRVEAAGQSAPPALAAPPAPQEPVAPVVAPTPAAPAPEPAPAVLAAPPAPGEPAPPPPPPNRREITVIVDGSSSAQEAYETRSDNRIVIRKEKRIVVSGADDKGKGKGKSYSYSYSDSRDGDSFALITGDHDNMVITGDGMDHTSGSLEKARHAAHGNFLWFTRKGKSYVVDDPATVAQVQGTYAAIEQLGRRQAELGKQQEAMSKGQEEVAIPTPDLSKEMAELNKTMARLQAKLGKTITQDELGELQAKLGDLQGRLGELEGELGEKEGRLGGLQGKLGAEQGHLGAEQEKLEAEADRKVRSIIDQSLANGKARPVR